MIHKSYDNCNRSLHIQKQCLSIHYITNIPSHILLNDPRSQSLTFLV